MRNLLLALLVTLAPLAAQPDRHGLPACAGPDRELVTKRAFIICHSGSLKAPVWSIHELLESNLSAPAAPRKHFRRDRSLAIPGAADADYRNSGFSRGHLVPARDMAHDEQALSDSFLLSNAVPQNVVMNRSIWRSLENRVRNLALGADSVTVVTGAIFPENPDRIGANGVAVPSHLYKVILVERGGRSRLLASVIPNSDGPEPSLDPFVTTVAEVEALTGLTFFPGTGHGSASPPDDVPGPGLGGYR